MNALVPIANGSEEIEVVTIIDILARGGTDVTVAAAAGSVDIIASRGVNITADCLIDDCSEKYFDLIAVPGGMPGSEILRDCASLKALLIEQNSSNRLIGAICAAPVVVLHAHGLLKNKNATCHPSFKDKMPAEIYSPDLVVTSDNIVTSQGPGSAIDFALKLVELLHGKTVADGVASGLVWR